MRKVISIGIILVWMCTLLAVSCVSSAETPATDEKGDSSPTLEPTEVPVKVEPTPEPTEEPTRTPEPPQTPQPEHTPGPQIGEFWLEVPDEPVAPGTEFTTKMFLNSGNQKIAAYGLQVSFDPDIVIVDTDKGTAGADPGADGYIAAANTRQKGVLTAAGFDVFGKGPGEKLHLITIHWKAVGSGTSAIHIVIQTAVDDTTADIGVHRGMKTSIKVK